MQPSGEAVHYRFSSTPIASDVSAVDAAVPESGGGYLLVRFIAAPGAWFMRSSGA